MERSHVERSSRDNGAAQRQVQEQRSTRENWDRNRSENRTENFDRNRSSNWNRNESRSSDWNRNNRSNDWNRNNNRSNDWNRNNRSNDWNRNNGYRGNRTPYFYNGRISRYERWNNGFRVYIGGAPYPFFVPEAFFRLHGLHVGLSIRLGGYYNPLGYYDYYDGPYDGYYGNSVATAGDLRGVVESVDYRRGTVVIRDDISGSFVSTVMRGRDRTFDTLRPGDYVEMRGDWVRGVFEAYRADLLDDRYYR